MSDGIRSGVNWMRRASSPSAMPIVSTSLVLARPGTPTSRRVAAGEDRDQRAIDHALLPEDHGADGGAGSARVRGRRLGGAHHHVLELLESFARDRHEACSCCFVQLSVAAREEPFCPQIMQTSRHNGGANPA